MKARRASASVLLLWLASCGGGGGPSDQPPPPSCVVPADGAGWLLFSADGDPDPGVVNYDVFAVKADGTCQQLLAAGPLFDLNATWSASTGLVAWGAFRSGKARVVLQPATGGPQVVLDTGPEPATGPWLSPDGTLVYFERTADGDATADVYVVPAAGGIPLPVAAGTIEFTNQQGTLVSCPANDAGPVFSDSTVGRYVYFVSSRSSASCAVSGQINEVWRQRVDSEGAPVGVAEQVTTGSQIVGRPAVSPDGGTLVYARPSTGFASKVVAHDLTTHVERTVSDRNDSEPAFSPDGTALAVRTMFYDTAGQGRGDIMLVDVATGDIRRRLTDGSLEVGSPAFPW